MSIWSGKVRVGRIDEEQTMPIQFGCPSCKREHRAPEEFAGRQVRCSCGTVFVVPSAAAPHVMATPPATPARFTPPPLPAASISPRQPRAAVPNAVEPDARAGEERAPLQSAYKTSPLARLLATRRKLVLAAGGTGAALLLGLATWMFFGRSGIREAMRYLPSDCLVVGTLNVDELTRSPLYQQAKSDLRDFEKAERGLDDEMGISPTNIDRVSFGAAGTLNSPNDAQLVSVFHLKKAVSAADIKANTKVPSYMKDCRFEESKIGGITIYERRFKFAFGGDKGDERHGHAFCLPESTLIVACARLDTLKAVLERGKPPDLSTDMKKAMAATDFSRTMAVALNMKELMGKEEFSRGLTQGFGGSGGLKPLNHLDDEFLRNMIGLSFDANLGSTKVTVNATLLCKEAKSAEDAKKILEGAQVVLRNAAKAQRDMPREVADMIDSIKFTVSGANVNGSVQLSLEPISKWIAQHR